MTDGSAYALQAAIFGALVTDPDIKAILGDPPRLFDDVPSGTAFPYATLGDGFATDWGTANGGGTEHSVTLHAWSRYSGRREAHDILSAFHAVLHEQALVVAGHHLVTLRFQYADVQRDEDGETYHGILRLRALTEPAP